tara:strand:+ start:168 stop:275 length:108 start_codon:yes stop_codon:yes gene_type:complete
MQFDEDLPTDLLYGGISVAIGCDLYSVCDYDDVKI